MKNVRTTSGHLARAMRYAVAFLAAAVMIFGAVESASALTLEEIKAMAATGAIDDNTIIDIIDKSNQTFELTPEQVAELESAGVSERVVNALKATAGSTATGGGGGTTDGGPVPLPATRGNLGALSAQGARNAKQTFDVEAATAKKLAEQARMDKIRAELELEFQKVDGFIRDWEASDKWSALATCHNFLAGFQPPESTNEYYLATWCKGQAFQDLGLHNLAAPILKDVVLMGAEKSQFETAFRSLVSAATEADYFPPGMAELDTLYIEDKAKPFQDEFNYFVGKFTMDTLKSYERAVTLFSRVSAESPLYPKAMYATGVMQSGPLKQAATGAQSFQNAIVAAETLVAEGGEPADEAGEIVELGYLALARIAYEAFNYEGALYYYNKVDVQSQRYPRALFEMAWTYFVKGDVRNALGTFHSVSSPYYDGYYFPDLWVLEATVYLNLCRYDLARESLQTFEDVYIVQQPKLTQFIADISTDPTAAYDQVVNGIAQGDGGPLPAIFGEAVLSNIQFKKVHDTIRELDTEIALAQSASSNLGPYGEELLANLQDAAETKRFEAGIATVNILREIENELTNWDVTSTEVAIEINIAEKQLQERCLTLAAQGKSCDLEVDEETVLFLVADDWQFWPFEGEYWVDEVGNYKSYLGDRCEAVDELAGNDAGDESVE